MFSTTNVISRTAGIAIRAASAVLGGNVVRRSTIALGAVAAAALACHAEAAPSWRSGGSGPDLHKFGAWRGTPIGVAVGWAPWKDGSWTTTLAYASSTNPRRLRSYSSNVSIGMPLFPKGKSLTECAAGKYAAYHTEFARRLAANGVGDADLRLGWEANNTSYPWTAVGKSADQWRACFTSAATALKQGSPGVRITWHMAKKGKLNVASLWPAAAPITYVGVSHYDDPYAKFGSETSNGSPWGLRAWLAFAKARGKQLTMAEWGVGRRGDNPSYIVEMYKFMSEAGSGLAHEGYFRGSDYDLYPSPKMPKAAETYRKLW